MPHHKFGIKPATKIAHHAITLNDSRASRQSELRISNFSPGGVTARTTRFQIDRRLAEADKIDAH